MEHKNKIISMFLVTASCIVITYYFVIVLEKGTVYTHLFYIPIILASLWWGRKGFYVSLFLSILLLLNHLFLRSDIPWTNDIGRALMFCIVGFFVGTLNEKRNKAEEALAASKAHTESIIRNFLDTLIVVDTEAKIKTINPATCHLLGYTEEELIGKPVSIIFAEKEKEEVRRLFQFFRELEKAEAFHFRDTIRNRELTYKTKDGRLIPLSFNASVITDEAGNITGVVAGAKDITERKKAEKELRESEEKFRRLFESNPEALVYVDKDFKIVDINPRFKELFGYSIDEIRGKDINEYIVPENKKDEARKLDEMSKKGYTFHETVRKKKNGTLVPVSTSAAPVISEGSIVGITVTYKDITKRKEMEKKLSTIYDLSREMTLSLDLDQISKLVLDATEKVLKFGNVDLFLIDEEKNELRLKEARGLKETERYTVIPLYGKKGISAHVARTGKSLIVPDVRKDERYLFGLKDSRSELCVPIKIKDRIIGVIDVESKELNAFSEDQRLLETLASQAAIAMENARLFGEEKRAKEQREKARKEAEFYSDLLGHDIGNLNQVILGYLYLLKNAKDEETRKKNIKGIKKSITKSKRLAESIRILKIIKDTKIEKFDLNKSIERSIRDIKEYFDREIEVNLNIDKKYYVKANDFLDKVFFNILENSVEYTFHDPVIIDIKIEEKDDFCNIHIRDNGIGIPKEKREDILRNLETLSKRTGIGLYLTKKILDRFDGKFEIKDVEKGTEIVITIPVMR